MYNRKSFSLIILLFIVALIVSCNKYAGDNKVSTRVNEKVIEVKGIVKLIELEGGFFGIIADDGSKYKPVNLPNNYQRDGLRISFEGKLRPDVVSIYMWGTFIEIVRINEL